MRKLKHRWFETLVKARRTLQSHPPEPHLTSTSSAIGSVRAFPTADFRSPPPALQLNEWPIEHCASEPEPFVSQLAARATPVALTALLLLLTALTVSAAVTQ